MMSQRMDNNNRHTNNTGQVEDTEMARTATLYL